MSNVSGDNDGYGDFTGISTDLIVGQDYTLTIVPGFSDDIYNEYFRAFIDLNQDGIFTPDEMIFDNGGPSSSAVSGTISLPTGTMAGSTIMRIIMNYGNAPVDPCDEYSYGETEEYTINVIDDILPVNYCESGGSSTYYEWIHNVSLGDINNTSGNNNGYGDYTSMATTVDAGLNYQIILTPGFSGSSYNENWKVWIDFNQDGDFDDLGELVFSQSSSTIVGGTISVPTDALDGSTRMRVAMRYRNSNFGPCGTFYYGETEDYTIVVNNNGDTPPTEYCGASGDNTYYEWIEAVSVDEFINLSGNNNGYGDFTSSVIDMTAGAVSYIQLQPGFGQGAYPEYWRVWIDLNQNGEFENSEILFDNDNAPIAGLVSGDLIVPSSASLGLTRMRIAMNFNNPPGPCGNFSWGEVEDYTVNIGQVAGSAPIITDLSTLVNVTSAKGTVIDRNAEENISLNIYPNPVQEFANISIELNGTQKVTCNLFALNGQEVYTITQLVTRQGVIQVPVGNLANGMYQVIVQTDTKRTAQQIVVSH